MSSIVARARRLRAPTQAKLSWWAGKSQTRAEPRFVDVVLGPNDVDASASLRPLPEHADRAAANEMSCWPLKPRSAANRSLAAVVLGPNNVVAPASLRPCRNMRIAHPANEMSCWAGKATVGANPSLGSRRSRSERCRRLREPSPTAETCRSRTPRMRCRAGR